MRGDVNDASQHRADVLTIGPAQFDVDEMPRLNVLATEQTDAARRQVQYLRVYRIAILSRCRSVRRG